MSNRLCLLAGTVVVSALFAGCGGGGATLGVSGSNPPVAPTEATAKFAVDVANGEVSVTPLSEVSRSIFDGTTVRFNTSTLLDQPGNTGRKVLGVSLTNESGEPIGVTPGGGETGVMVRFSPFVNVASFSDLRPKTDVSTLAGNGTPGTADGQGGTATFSAPFGVCLSGDGAVLITDSTGHKVRMYRNGVVSTMAGSGVAGNTNGAGTAAKLNGPTGIARNPVDGAFFICDNLGNRIRRMTADGIVSTIAGTGAAGSANGAGSASTFTGPRGIAVANDGTIYVTEDGHRIRRIVFNGGAADSAANYTVSNRAGDGTAGFQNGTGITARFNLPAGIVCDENGIAYVADRANNRIRRIGLGGEVSVVAGDGTGGGADGPGSAARFSQPVGIAYANGALAVAEMNGNRIRQITLTEGSSPNVADNWRVATLAGNGTAGSADGTSGSTARFDTPALIAMSAGNEIFVADTANNKLRSVIPKNGVFPIGTPGGSVPDDKVSLANASGYTGRDSLPYISYPGALSPGESTGQQEWVFVVPKGVKAFEFSVSVEADTAYYMGLDGVSNPGPTGAGSRRNFVRTLAGGDLGGFVDGAATVAKFNSANGLTMDGSGILYLADSNNHAIRRVEPSGEVNTIAGLPGTVGANDGPGNLAGLNGPRGVAATPDGTRVFVADSNNHTIRMISLVGPNPRDPASWYVTTIAGLAGDAVYAEGRGNAARFNFPVGIAYQDDTLFITEFSGNRVRRLELLTTPATTAGNWQSSLIAGSSVSPVGTAGATNGFGTSARFDLPAHICVDAQGVLYVADVNNSRIRKILPNSNVSTFAGSTFGYADGVGEAAMFGQPNGVTVDPSGYVFVADTSFHRLRRISPSGVVTTAAGNGNTFPEVDGGGDVNNFYFPLGLVASPTGTVYVVSGGTYEFEGGGGVTSPGLRIKIVQRTVSSGAP